MFVLDDVAKFYRDGDAKRWVFRNLTHDFTRARTIGVIGPSGSGKSTLLSMLCGLLAADEGSVRFDHPDEPLQLEDASATSLREFRARRVGFIYQFFNLIPTLTARENVLLPLELTRQPELTDAAEARLLTLGMKERMHAFPDELSGGEQQRVAVARAFAHEPSVILADEPTGNLDRDTGLGVIDLLWGEVQRSGATLIVASHDERVSERCEDILSLEH